MFVLISCTLSNRGICILNAKFVPNRFLCNLLLYMDNFSIALLMVRKAGKHCQ